MKMRRRSPLLPFTLTEVLALLFFVLALALVREASKRAEAERSAEAHVKLASVLGPEGVEDLARVLDPEDRPLPEDFDELVRDAQLAAEAREILEQFIEEAEGVDGLDGLDDPDSTEPDDLATQISDLLERLRDRNRNLHGQIANLRRRAGSGLDHPPCWADERGRPEYALRVTLREGSVDVEPIWPPHREAEAESTPGMSTIAGAGLRLDEFGRHAAPILAWSRRQEPECRHVVRIVDRVPADQKDLFIDELLAVEHYFYKYLER